MLSGSTQRGRTASSRQPRQVPSCSSEPPGRSSAPRVQAAEAAQGGNPPRSRAPPLPPRASYRSRGPRARPEGGRAPAAQGPRSLSQTISIQITRHFGHLRPQSGGGKEVSETNKREAKEPVSIKRPVGCESQNPELPAPPPPLQEPLLRGPRPTQDSARHQAALGVGGHSGPCALEGGRLQGGRPGPGTFGAHLRTPVPGPGLALPLPLATLGKRQREAPRRPRPPAASRNRRPQSAAYCNQPEGVRGAGGQRRRARCEWPSLAPLVQEHGRRRGGREQSGGGRAGPASREPPPAH